MVSQTPRRFSVCELSLPSVKPKQQHLVLVISPDELNRHLATLLVSPMTTVTRPWPSRVTVHFAGKDGDIALERIHTIDRDEVLVVLGQIPAKTAHQVAKTLVEMFTF